MLTSMTYQDVTGHIFMYSISFLHLCKIYICESLN